MTELSLFMTVEPLVLKVDPVALTIDPVALTIDPVVLTVNPVVLTDKCSVPAGVSEGIPNEESTCRAREVKLHYLSLFHNTYC